MEISYLGHDCFRIRGREASILTDPFPPSYGLNMGRPSAAVVTVSHSDSNHEFTQGVTGEYKLITGPGEYEIADVLINGVQTYRNLEGGDGNGSRPKPNTAYVFEVDELRVCHLGDLAQRLNDDQIEGLGTINVLMVPVGGHGTIGPNMASDVVSKLEPSVVIPMHFRIQKTQDESLEPVDRFVREMGVKEWSPVPKLSVTKSSLPSEIQVVVMEPRKA
jgi:L-ascorbate metabolism protein UlaG (beta-lactamase superfamily)